LWLPSSYVKRKRSNDTLVAALPAVAGTVGSQREAQHRVFTSLRAVVADVGEIHAQLRAAGANRDVLDIGCRRAVEREACVLAPLSIERVDDRAIAIVVSK
jgi:hypothetical protein